MRNNFKKRASALLISFFLMAILITVGLGVGTIVFRDISSIRTILNGKTAAYAAEGMSELGLQILKEKLPGYETELKNSKGKLTITARGNSIPCEGEWRNLTLNESLQLALFAQTDEGIDAINDFSVTYYLPDNPMPQGNVLRWKILGMDSNNKTEAISDYLDGSGLKIFDSNSNAKFYAYENGGYIFYEQYPISTFLANHQYNYLILSNVVQLSGAPNVGSYQDIGDEDINTINLKLTGTSKKAVCEYAVLNSTADYGDARKSIKTVVKEGENLPVFDFALYNAKKKFDLSAFGIGN
ncbi:hypothetical protein HY463_01275 [Candidatus Peregrinibacteria bacterium]|nr:hypothetical protein [Candidatus Peregrinibacteria bacterium]